ncbi:MAG: DUF2235 domain-containing protein [Nitrospira sp.]|nr:DUF2235 domain-containing protein [Nitrospira sp.]
MTKITSEQLLKQLLPNALLALICTVSLSLTASCATIPSTAETESSGPMHQLKVKGDVNKHKSIFVFLDGTKNNSLSGTNVWRLYDLLSKSTDEQLTAIYIPGVGSIDKPVLGAALGKGMEERILNGYDFVAKHYNPGDGIFIFGFSRGAHETRSLAGLLSYVGVPTTVGQDHTYGTRDWNAILELTKDKSDEDYTDKWTSWTPDQPPLLGKEIKDKLKIEMRAVTIAFLGVWDTVPGSSFINFGVCKGEKGFFKRWVPFLTPAEGDRYKSDSYPPIHQIAHAVSLDEKRSKFAPLLLCPTINPQYTSLNEEWFPGAHSDIGGGYEDSNDLAGLSFNWMLGLLAKSYHFEQPPSRFNESASGLAHWSMGDAPGNWGSECEDRRPPKEAQIHKSVGERRNSEARLPIRIKGETVFKPYPIKCSDIEP